MMKLKVLIAYSMTIFLWGSAFPVIKIGLQSFSAEHLSALRLLIAAGILLIFGVIRKIGLPMWRDVPIIFLLGFLGFTVYHTALNFGEESVSAGTSSLLVSTVPILSAILSSVFLTERFFKMGWLGSLIAFVGVTMISLGMEGLASPSTLGALLILIAALGESFYFVFQTSYLNKYGFIPFTVYTVIAGSLCMLFFLPGISGEITSASSASIYAVLYLALFPTIAPYFALAYVTSKVGASEATSALYLTPAVALFIAWILLGEVPTILSLVGGTLTLIGVSLATLNGQKDKVATREKVM